MRASLQITMTGLNDQDCAIVSARVLILEPSGEYRHANLYQEKRYAQDLGDHMSIEAWALATLASHSDAIKEALARAIREGQRTLIEDAVLSKRD